MSNEFTNEKEGMELPYVYKLKYPFKFKSKEITEMTFERRPKAVDFKGLNATSMRTEETFTILSRICAVPVQLIEELDAHDFIKIQEVFADFLPNSG